MSIEFRVNNSASLKFTNGIGQQETLTLDPILAAVLDCHAVIDTILNQIPVDIFSILGMRNLSAFVGELFAKSLEKEFGGFLKSNPHQDGYPDLLLMNNEGLRVWKQLEVSGSLREKTPFSPFINGGIEIKATCGSVPTPKQCAKKGMEKPGMGEPRIPMQKGYDWKAHHRETTNLLSIFWDFDDLKSPRIMAVFFGNDLTEGDWGKIVQPKEGGGRTTSVSIMTRFGVKKMYENWVLVADDERYINFFNSHNKDHLM